ncbi:MAG: hypothetical protein IKO42_02080 [Opitutales bacterium]|nr:hypothetical protein [Opitutales bacterium]
MKKLFAYIMLVALASSLSGCFWDEKIENYLTLHVCESRSEIGLSRENIKMPETGVEFTAVKDPFMTMGDLESVDIAEVYDPYSGKMIRGFQLNCAGMGAKKLFRETSKCMGGWIILKENGKPCAIRKIDSIITNGKLFMMLKYPKGTDIYQKAQEYSRDIKKIQEEIKQREAYFMW